MAFSCFYKTYNPQAIKLCVIPSKQYDDWLSVHANNYIRTVLSSQQFEPRVGNSTHLFDETGQLTKILLLVDPEDMWGLGGLSGDLPANYYVLEDAYDVLQSELPYLAFGLGCYQFIAYKTGKKSKAVKLYLPPEYSDVEKFLHSIYLVRDMVNTPAEDMGPEHVADLAQKLAHTFSAKFSQIIGDELAEKGYGGIHAVGRASSRAPRLVRLDWGKKEAPHVVLVGKGVVFDTGGLNAKGSKGMLLMHKDMGGAAQVMGLARLIMETNLPIRLTMLIPAVENSISGNAYRPSDILKMYNGSTVEVTNTDAEGRLVLADALTEASRMKPELIMDFATLTGAARVAVGTEMAAFFSNNVTLINELKAASERTQDPVWHMPLFKQYKKLLSSRVADLKNSSTEGYAGSITAALFLESFVENNVDWVHFDLMAWNVSSMAGRPIGGEAMALRAAYEMLKTRYVTN